MAFKQIENDDVGFQNTNAILFVQFTTFFLWGNSIKGTDCFEVLDPVYNAYEAQLQLLINGAIVCTGECVQIR
ncbi:MAG: hypothetical protein IPP17_26780 [Bacteroidetes bacterium]|nr:hypothetical protein [Bacteroidota bacterium]